MGREISSNASVNGQRSGAGVAVVCAGWKIGRRGKGRVRPDRNRSSQTQGPDFGSLHWLTTPREGILRAEVRLLVEATSYLGEDLRYSRAPFTSSPT